MAETTFTPRWQYHKDGRTHLAMTIEDLAALEREAGWSDTPAVHGVITAPSAEDLAKMPRVLTPESMLPGAGPQEQIAFSHLLMQWQKKLDMMEASQAALAERLEMHGQEVDMLRQFGNDMSERVHSMEQWVVQHDASTDDDPKPRRRSPRDSAGEE